VKFHYGIIKKFYFENFYPEQEKILLKALNFKQKEDKTNQSLQRVTAWFNKM